MSVFCCFACCLSVVLGFWYTFVVSNVFLRVPKTDSDFRCTEKAAFTVNARENKICTTAPSATTTLVNVNIVFITH